MAEEAKPTIPGAEIFAEMFRLQAEMSDRMMKQLGGGIEPAALPLQDGPLALWSEYAEQVKKAWSGAAVAETTALPGAAMAGVLADPEQWRQLANSWYANLPLADPKTRDGLLKDSLALWDNVLAQYGIGPEGSQEVALPRKDRRFADPRWHEQPIFAVIHQAYLLLSEQLEQLADRLEGIDPAKREQLRFSLKTMAEALSPANFLLTNPVVLEKTLETGGENLVHGLDHLLTDLGKGQLTHADATKFEMGRNIAATPGKVVHETPLYQLIQYTPTTDKVAEVPLVIFPPWINRFYILDLNPQKSFVRWAVEQGLSVFIVSWKSADESMAELVWDDYIRAQIEVIDLARERLKVPSVHTIGYCVAGTTLAATLAVLARRGEADKVATATFFTAQVDFEHAGDLKAFVDDNQLALVAQLSQAGYLDGRYMAATFNLLRSSDLIWSYVINNYLLGEEYPAFDLLYWNSDTTNLPARWHQAYLRDLYRDNLLVVPDRLSADGTPIDLSRIVTPCYVQAGKEDHIAPLESVWRFRDVVKAPLTFVLAGSGHIAGVVNPPSSGKYQYWTNDKPVESLDAFIAGATETPGSWWPHWRGWLAQRDGRMVPAKGKRVPGGRGEKVIEDAPGRYVAQR